MFIELLFKLIVLFLPTQLGLHFWPNFSRVGGIKIDYLSPTLYFTDLLLILFITSNLKLLFLSIRRHYISGILFLLFIFLNTVLSISPLNSLFWWSRTILYLLTFVAVKQLNFSWKTIKSPLFIGTLIVVIIEIAQLCLQHSLNGALYLLGERHFSSATPGLGRLNLFGREIIRPMSTFSHPNSLAGYLLVVFYLFSVKKAGFVYRVVPFLGILLSLSKAALTFLFLYLFQVPPQYIIVLSLLLSLIPNFYDLTKLTASTISDRLFYHQYQKQILRGHELTGVGLGSYIPALEKHLPGSSITPQRLQPIHNLFYLLVNETGILGTTLIVFGIIKTAIRKIIVKPKILGLISLVIFVGVFDHYFWTLPQNKLILLLAFSILI